MTRPLDRATIHAKALRTAAAVAFGTAGCGATAIAGPAGATAEVQSDSSVENADAASRAVDAGSASGADAAADTGTDAAAGTGTDATAGSGPDTAADAVAAADVAADGRPDCSKPPARGDAECCQKLTTWCENAYAKDSKAQSDCVWGPDFDGSTGCIPWGPPAPPEWSGVRVQGLA